MKCGAGGILTASEMIVAEGPIEFLMVGFPGTDISAAVNPAIQNLITAGTIRMLDLKFVVRSDDGSLFDYGYDVIEAMTGLVSLSGFEGHLIGQADIDLASATLEPGTSAVLLLWEDVWAIPFADALREANGTVIDAVRVPLESVVEEPNSI
jgi:hypothetical protein